MAEDQTRRPSCGVARRSRSCWEGEGEWWAVKTKCCFGRQSGISASCWRDGGVQHASGAAVDGRGDAGGSSGAGLPLASWRADVQRGAGEVAESAVQRAVSDHRRALLALDEGRPAPLPQRLGLLLLLRLHGRCTLLAPIHRRLAPPIGHFYFGR